MVRITNMNCLVVAVLVAFVFSGCQSSNNKWATAWKERTKPKPKFQGLDDTEEVTYWPYKADKSRQRKLEGASPLKEKLAKKTEMVKRDEQFKELLTQGDQFQKNGQFDDARIAYKQALQVTPDSPEVNHRLAILADKQKQYSVADEHYQAALRVQPRNINLMSDLGYSYYLRGDLRQAEITLKQALDIDRTHQMAMANLGAVYAQQNRREEALAMFRAGAGEVAAQRYYNNLFPQDRAGAAPALAQNMPGAHSGPALEFPKSTTPRADLSKMSFDEIRAEMARLGQEEKRRRYEADQRELAQARQFSAGQELDRKQQFPASTFLLSNGNRVEGANAALVAPQGVDDWGNPVQPAVELKQQPVGSMNSPAMSSQTPAGPFEIVRGSARLQPGLAMAPQNSPGSNAQASGYQNNPQMGGNFSNASQVAAEMAMSFGPGSLFPIVQSPTSGGIQSADHSNSVNNRMGGEFHQPPAYQNQNTQNWSGNRIEQTSVTAPNGNAPIEGTPSIAPASPANDWSSPTNGRLNWQNDSSSSSSWTNDLSNSGAAGTGLDSGAGQLIRSQSQDQNSTTLDNSNSGQPTQIRPGTDSSRPYNGTWPNSNSLPVRPSQSYSTNYGSMDNQVPAMAPNGGGVNQPANQTGVPANANGTSLPMWKYAPNR